MKKVLIISFLLLFGGYGFGQTKLDGLIISGTINQTLDYSYLVEVTFLELKIGEVAGTTNYPSIPCVGIITFLRMEGDYYYFKESFEEEDVCVKNGTIVIHVLKGKQFSFDWYYSNKKPGSRGVLTKGKLK